MRVNSLFGQVMMVLLGMVAGLSPLTLAAAAGPQELVQVHASRATSSLLLLRGEGYQDEHRQRLETDLQALADALQQLPQGSDSLRAAHAELVKQLRRGVAFGPGEENMPWGYLQELSKALREVLSEARALASEDESALAAKVEYLAVQYLSRSYLGSFEIAREQPDTYVGQDERLLVPAVDQELEALTAKDDPQVAKLMVRWAYLKAALSDMNSASNALESLSGRPFAPITVDRHSRALSKQLMAMN